MKKNVIFKRLIPVLAALVLVFAAATACAEREEFILGEDSGGVFKPLPINLDGGYKLSKDYKYSGNLMVYEDPTIRVERFRIDRGSNRPEWPVNCAYAIIEIKDPSQIRTASADEANPFRSSATKVARAIAKLKNAVFAVNGDTSEEVSVTTGFTTDGFTEILDSDALKDRQFVVEGQYFLNNGSRIEIQ